MDAKYNWIIDNAAIRIGLMIVGFAAWLSVSIGLLYL